MSSGIKKYLLLFCFPLMIALPLLNEQFNFITDVESFENRALAKKPEFNIQKLDPFPVRYDTFYNDNFSYRSGLIQIYNAYKLKVFRRSPVPDKVAISKDNWLFPMGNEFDCFMGKDSLRPWELELLKKEFEYRSEYLLKQNCKMYVLVAPSKASAYTEKLGREYFPLNSLTWGGQFIDFLKKNSKVNVISFIDSIEQYKPAGNLYYQLDNHWNDLGGFFAANEVIKHMKVDFQGLQLLNIENYRLNRKEVKKGNMQKMLGNLISFSEVDNELIPKAGYGWKAADKVPYPPVPGFAYPEAYEKDAVQADTTKPRLLVISDSFGNALFPYLAENFSRTVLIFDAWQYKLNQEIVTGEKPDAVLFILYEPLIRNVLLFQEHLHSQ